jgi:hypothetical protein
VFRLRLELLPAFFVALRELALKEIISFKVALHWNADERARSRATSSSLLAGAATPQSRQLFTVESMGTGSGVLAKPPNSARISMVCFKL